MPRRRVSKPENLATTLLKQSIFKYAASENKRGIALKNACQVADSSRDLIASAAEQDEALKTLIDDTEAFLVAYRGPQN